MLRAASQNHQAAASKRLRTLNLLRQSMARTGLKAPVLDTTNITIAAQSATSTFASGFNDWLVTNGHTNKFTFLGGQWAAGGATFPNNMALVPTSRHAGNGTDPSVTPAQQPSARVRFFTEAPKFELYIQAASAAGGFRLLVDGKYAKQGVIGNTEDGNLRFVLVTFGDGTATFRQPRLIELEFAFDGGFGGVRMDKLYAPRPVLQPDNIRLLVHGDSRVTTAVDTADITVALGSVFASQVGFLLGLSDVVNSGVGSTGWISPSNHSLSWFNDRVTLDVVGYTPELIIETGGSNDQSLITAYGQSNYQALVETWINTVIAAKPETVIFMSGPMTAIETDNTAANWVKVRDAKAAAAAKFPQNVSFIDNMAEGWVTGTGRQGATNGTGQTDWTLGGDAAHNTLAGNWWYADRYARAIAERIPALIAAQ